MNIAPLSAAKHYAAGSDFWENRAKALQSQLDEALERIGELEALVPPPPDEDKVQNADETRS